MKIVKSQKFLNVFCYVFCGIYLFFAISVSCINASVIDARENDFNNLVSYVNSVNKRVEEENLIRKNQSQNSNNDGTSDSPIFSDGKTALLTAYEKFYNSKSFIAKVEGTIKTNIIGIDIKISLAITSIKYNENKYYDEFLIRYLDASSMQATIEKAIQYGKQTYKVNDIILKRDCLKVSCENGVLSGYDYKAVTTIKEAYPICENLLIINENTIQEITYFKIQEKNGKPQYYYVQAVLNPETATVNFKKASAFSTEKCDFGIPSYTKNTITACIDAKGNLIGLTCVDSATAPATGPGVGTITAACDYTYTYAISGMNEEITYVPEGF